MSQSENRSKSRVNAPGLTLPFSRPWHDLEYAEDYESAFRLIRGNREAGNPTRLKQVVEWVYSADYTDTQYKRISRFVDNCDYFKTNNIGNFVLVEPTLAVFGLPLESDTSIRQKRNTEAGLEKDPSSSDLETDTTEKYAEDRLESLLNKVTQINSNDHADHRHGTLREFESYRDSITGTLSIFEHRLRDNQHLAIPNTTRFTDSTDASKSQIRFNEALDTARENFAQATVMSLTIDPKRHESHAEATEAAREAKQKLLSRLSYQCDSPTQMTITDFQKETGLLHYHIVLFGVSIVSESQNKPGNPTISESQVREYWDSEYNIGSQISLDRAWNCDRREKWLLHQDDDSTVSLQYYLGKRIRELGDLGGLDPGKVPLDYYRHALFWVYGLRYVSCSDSLKETNEDESQLPDTLEWDYIGTCRYEQIPAHIRENMILVGTSG
jgi:hypothetical protein